MVSPQKSAARNFHSPIFFQADWMTTGCVSPPKNATVNKNPSGKTGEQRD